MMRTIAAAILAVLAGFALPAVAGTAAGPAVKPHPLAAGTTTGATIVADAEALERLRQIIVDLIGVNPAEVTAETRLSDDLGMDELDLVELVIAVEDEFGITVSDDTAESLRTVGDFVVVIEGGHKG